MSGPHIAQDDRDAIDDRGLIADDNTEDFHLDCPRCRYLQEMRTAPAMSSVGALGGGRSNSPITRKAVHP